MKRAGLPLHAYTRASIAAAPCRPAPDVRSGDLASFKPERYGLAASIEPGALSDPSVLRDVTEALASLPPALLDQAGRRLRSRPPREAYRLIFSATRQPRPHPVLAVTITGYPPPSQRPRTEFYLNWTEPAYRVLRQGLFMHEYAHFVGNETGLDTSPEWLRAAGWEVKGSAAECNVRPERCLCRHRERLLSVYGADDPIEDFAETFAAYRLNPRYLQKKSPEKYSFMKLRVFDGLEYTLPDLCARASAPGAALPMPSPSAIITPALEPSGPPVPVSAPTSERGGV